MPTKTSIKDIYAKCGLHIQVGQSNCGPASLLNALRLRGDKRYSEDELAKLCNCRVGIGTDHEDLVKTAKKIGLEVATVKRDATLDDLRRCLDDGYYALINYTPTVSSKGHYSLAVEYDDEAFYIWDCGYGLIMMDNAGLEACWHSGDKKVWRWFMAVK